jgi:hypothetical protein
MIRSWSMFITKKYVDLLTFMLRMRDMVASVLARKSGHGDGRIRL